jgi:hypothetical protein
MRNVYKILGVKLETPMYGQANITANLVQETNNIRVCSDYIHLAEDEYFVWPF